MVKEGFYTNSISIIFNPSKFVLDFKQTTPHIDRVCEKDQQLFATTHSIVLLDPQFAKVFLGTLKNSIESYEKKFGKIKVIEKKNKKEKAVASSHSYIG